MTEDLSSWRDGPAKQAIINFMARTCGEGGAPAVPPEERLRWPTLRLLVLHDDAEREFAYTAGAKKALSQTDADGWTVVSVKNDWATVFRS